jgi:uncharacterized protein YcbK (DUF882 family)
MGLAEIDYSQYNLGSIVNRTNYAYTTYDNFACPYTQFSQMQLNIYSLINNSVSWQGFNCTPQTINFFTSPLYSFTQSAHFQLTPSLQTASDNIYGFDTFTSSSTNITASHLGTNYEHRITNYTYDNSNDKFADNNKNYLKNLNPEMRKRTEQLIAYANSNGYDVKITSGKRTSEEQKQLQKKYAKQPGRVAKRSAHVAGKAIDIEVYKNGVKVDEGYNLLGNYAKNELGMRWGGDFKSYRERWHFDYGWA